MQIFKHYLTKRCNFIVFCCFIKGLLRIDVNGCEILILSVFYMFYGKFIIFDIKCCYMT